ncbi:MAG: Sua5/YciO/YrdC/YwlC family protein [Gammaproteobacteria bacterium]|nr:Sua5/YciO/YrdC/YwlC family protein [Gammaproteobacteria bacterium]
MVSQFNIRKAALAIKQGGIIAYPTEAVYGLGCDPYQQTATFKLLELKNRPVEKGLILVGSRLEQFYDFIEPLTSQQQKLIQSNRQTSWIAPACHAPFWLRGKHQSLAIRLSAHPVVMQLCDTLGQALVSTSANRSHKEPARSGLKAHQYFHHELDVIISADTGTLGQPTEIRDLLTHKIIRAN